MLLKELRHEGVVRLDCVHINRLEPSISLAFDYAEHDLYEMIKHNRDKGMGGRRGDRPGR
jgi:cyclin-dependent kinase 8/11